MAIMTNKEAVRKREEACNNAVNNNLRSLKGIVEARMLNKSFAKEWCIEYKGNPNVRLWEKAAEFCAVELEGLGYKTKVNSGCLYWYLNMEEK